MAVTQTSAPAPEEQATASPAPPVSPVQSRLRWMEIATRLLLLASVAIFAWAAMSIFFRPMARKLIESPKYGHSSLDDEARSESPVDFYQRNDDDNDDDDPAPVRRRQNLRNSPPNTDDKDIPKDGEKAELIAGSALRDAKLYGQPSDRSAEMGEVRAGESIFVMKETQDWVLVLRGEGAMLGWMRRDNLKSH